MRRQFNTHISVFLQYLLNRSSEPNTELEIGHTPKVCQSGGKYMVNAQKWLPDNIWLYWMLVHIAVVPLNCSKWQGMACNE